MIRIEDIPDFAICSKCGKPLKVIDLKPQATKLGVTVPEGSFVFRCCSNAELTIEDETAELYLRDLLLQYHTQKKQCSVTQGAIVTEKPELNKETRRPIHE